MKQHLHNGITYAISLMVLLILASSIYIALTIYSNTIIGRDEANFVLRSTMAILDANNFSAWMSALTQTHGQHVLIGMQLGNLLSYYTLGYIDFRLINLLGVVYLLVPVCLLLTARFSLWKDRIWVAAILLPLALSPGHSSCAINAACTGNHYLGLCFALASLYVFCNSKRLISFIAAEGLLMLAVLSSPAALPLVLLVFPVIWLKQHQHQHLHRFVLHTFFSAGLMLAYYSATHAIDEPTALLSSNNLAMELLLVVLAFLNITGNLFVEPQSMAAGLLTVAIGLCVVIAASILLWQTAQHYQQAKAMPLPFPLLLYSSGLVLMLAMILLISIGRHQGWGNSRYIFYSAFTWMMLILLFAELHPERFTRWRPWLAAICLAYYPVQYGLATPYLDGLREQIVMCEERWQRENKACGVMIPHNEATQLLQQAYQRGIVR